MSKAACYKEADKMRYTMKTNARRALKTRYGQVARDAHEQLIHEDDVGFFIVDTECRRVVREAEKHNSPAPTAPAYNHSSSPVLRNLPNPVIVKSCLEAIKKEEAKDVNHSKAEKLADTLRRDVYGNEEVDMANAIKAAPKVAEKEIKAARCTFKNGARKPLKGKTAEVWAMTLKLTEELGRAPTIQEMKTAMPSYNTTTISIQYYACKKFHNL